MAKMPLAEFRPDRPRRARRREIPHYVFSQDESEWTGPVVRLEALTEDERAAIGAPPRGERPRSVHLTWRCVNEFCRNWTMNGSYVTGRCNFCFTPRGRV